MSPDRCIFCHILRGASPASVVYADEQVVAFMDIRPVTPGHLLVVPRVHAAHLAELDPAVGGHLFRVGMKLDQALRRSGIPCEGVNLFLADGRAAGQEVMHVHLHVLPRYQGDGFGFRFPARYSELPGREALDDAAARIRAGLATLSHAG